MVSLGTCSPAPPAGFSYRTFISCFPWEKTEPQPISLGVRRTDSMLAKPDWLPYHMSVCFGPIGQQIL